MNLKTFLFEIVLSIISLLKNEAIKIMQNDPFIVSVAF